MQMFKSIKANFSNAGFSLIELMIVVAMSSVVVVGASYFVLDTQKAEKKAQTSFFIQEQRLQIQRSISSAAQWSNVKTENPDMSCFNAGTSCSAFTTPQKLKLPVNGVVIDGNNAGLGLSPEGNFCYTFDAAAGDKNCPFGLDMTWKATCNDTDCKNAQPRIDVNFKFKDPTAATAPNLESYRITQFQDARAQNISDVCTGMGGTIVGASCQITALTGQCDPTGAGALFPIGFDSDGKIICGKPGLDPCPTDQVVVGFDSTGKTLCAPKCISGPGVVNCQGSWSDCLPACGGTGTQNFTVTTAAQNGGYCEAINGQSRSCGGAVCGSNSDCVGSWSPCDRACGGGTQTYGIQSPAQGTGAACPVANGTIQACNTTACAATNCVGSWGSCDSSTGLETFIVTTPASGTGTACSNASGDTRTCAVNCVGKWSACTGTGVGSYSTYSYTVTAKNGGVQCPYPNGYRDFDGQSGRVCSNATGGGGTGPVCVAHSCFVAGTKVKLANGKYQDIEKIKAGDQVISYDEHTKKQRVDTVDYPTAHEAKWQILHHFKLANETTFTSNEIHPFYVVEKDSYFEAQEIEKMLQEKKSVSFLTDKNIAVKIVSLKTEKKFVPVYNFEVRGISKHDDKYGKWGRGHNYYVHGILTHNKATVDPATGTCSAPSLLTVEGTCAACRSGYPVYQTPGGNPQCCTN